MADGEYVISGVWVDGGGVHACVRVSVCVCGIEELWIMCAFQLTCVYCSCS